MDSASSTGYVVPLVYRTKTIFVRGDSRKNCVDPEETLTGFHLMGETDSQGGLDVGQFCGPMVLRITFAGKTPSQTDKWPTSLQNESCAHINSVVFRFSSFSGMLFHETVTHDFDLIIEGENLIWT